MNSHFSVFVGQLKMFAPEKYKIQFNNSKKRKLRRLTAVVLVLIFNQVVEAFIITERQNNGLPQITV